VRNENGNPVTYPMSVDAILSVEDGQDIKAGDVVARIPREGAKTKDITGGLPRVAELFEARRPKDHAIIAEIDGTSVRRDYKNKRRIAIEPADETMEPVEYLVPKGKHIPVQEGDFIQKGDYIWMATRPRMTSCDHGDRGAGRLPDRRGAGRLSSAGREDQRQAHRGDRPPDAAEVGDPRLRRDHALKGEQVDKIEFDEANEKADGQGRRAGAGRADPARHHQGVAADPVVHLGGVVPGDHAGAHRGLGAGQARQAVGLKENVIVGRLIPAGTGGATRCGTGALYKLFQNSGVPSLHHLGRRHKVKGEFELMDENPQKRIDRNLRRGRMPLDGLEEFRGFFDMEYSDRKQRIENYRYFARFAEAYPDALFIMNTRNKDRWLRSRIAHNNGRFLQKTCERTGLSAEAVLERLGGTLRYPHGRGRGLLSRT
jgi:hypothetical protein